MENYQWELFINEVTRSLNLNEKSRKLLQSFPAYSKNTGSSLNKFVFDKYIENFGSIERKSYDGIKNTLFKSLVEAKFISFDNNANRGKLEYVKDELNRQFEQRIGNQLTRVSIHQKFPIDLFQSQIALNLESCDISSNHKFGNGIDILQTYAPNLDRLVESIVESVKSNLEVRILLVWTKSQAATIRSEALARYANLNKEFDIENEILRNLEILSTIINRDDIKDYRHNLKVRLYDSSPSISLYRVNNCLLQGYFMHKNLAINSTWLQFDLNESFVSPSETKLTYELMDEFQDIWKIGKDFSLNLNSNNWRSNLEELFLGQ
jgi:hypothetical protein